MATTRPIEIPIALTGADKVVAGFRNVVSTIETRAQALRGVGDRLTSSFSGLNGVMSLVTGAVVVEGLKRAVTAFQEEEVAITRVEIALRRFGSAAASSKAELIGQAEAMEAITGLSVEAVLGAQAMLLSTGSSVETVKSMVPLIADLAAAMGSDMTSATRLIGSALDGETIRLGRFNIEAENTQDLIRQLTVAVGGQAAAINQSRGSYLAFQVAWDDIGKLFGRVLTQPVTGFLTGVANGIQQIVTPLDEAIQSGESLIARLTGGTEAVGLLVGKIAPYAVLTTAGLLAVNAGMKVVTVSTGVLGGAFMLLTGQTFGPLISALQALSVEAGLTATVFQTGGAAANVFAVGIAGIGVAIAGFQLGKFINQIEITGDTIEDRLTRGILTAQQTWYMAKVTMGLATDEEREKVEELGVAIAQTGAEYRRQQAEAEAARAAAREDGGGGSAGGGSGAAQDPARARALAIARGQVALAVDRETLARGRAALDQDYESQAVSLQEFLEWRRDQIATAYQQDLAEGLQKAASEKDVEKRKVMEEAAFALATQKQLTAQQDLAFFEARERRTAAEADLAEMERGIAAMREEDLRRIDEATADRREANATRIGEIEGAIFLTAVEKRRELIELDEIELGILDDQIAALTERLRLETDTAAQASIRGQIRSAQQERAGVGRRRSGRLAEADPDSLQDQWDVAITGLQERLNTVAQGIANTFSSVVQGAVDGISSSIQGLIYRTMSWGDALRNIGGSVVTALIGAISKMFAEWILKMTLVRALESMFSTQRKAETATELPLNVANSAAASGGSFGASALLGLIAFAALMAAALSFGGAFAKGGRPKRGTVNLVGEEGPELWVPDVSGTIIPADRTAAALARLGGGAPTGGAQSTTRRATRSSGGSTVIIVDDKTEASRHLRSSRGEAEVRELVRGELMRLGVV